MIDIFIFTLFLTFLFTRVFSHILHDRKDFGTKEEKSKTITFFIRKKFKKDIHHIHLGFLMLILSFPLFFLFEKSAGWIIFFSIGLSLVLDQIIPYLGNREGYFTKRRIFESLILHILVAIIYLRIS